ncbi:MAG: hypothetical protein WA130_02180 [Candidatus Methanoperedens sp.]
MYCSDCGEKIAIYAFTFSGYVGLITIFAEDIDEARSLLADNIIHADEYELENKEKLEE